MNLVMPNQNKLNIELSVQLLNTSVGFDQYGNAVRAMKELPTSALYVEGFVVIRTHQSDHMLLNHAWCVVNDEIIDTTFVERHADIYKYYQCMTFTRAEVQQRYPNLEVLGNVNGQLYFPLHEHLIKLKTKAAESKELQHYSESYKNVCMELDTFLTYRKDDIILVLDES